MKKLLLSVMMAVLLLAGCSSSGGSSAGLEDIAAYPETMNLSVGDFQTIQVVLTPADADQKDLIYATSNQAVAVVDSSGKVTAVGAGACTITVASQAYSDVSCHVEVVVGGQAASQTEQTVPISDGYVGYVEETDPSRVYPTYYLSDGEVAAMDPEQLQFVINQIYAKNGYIFSKDHIQSYFAQMPWYTPVSRDANSLNMSKVDRTNLNLLVQHRGSNSGVSGLGWMWTRHAVDSELTSSYVSNLSDYDIQLLINTIYAKNGYIFETDSLQAMFEGQPWYQGVTRDGKSLHFSALDQKNLRLLTSYRS